MPSTNVMLIAALGSVLWYGGLGLYHGAKKAGHAIVRVLKKGVHPKK